MKLFGSRQTASPEFGKLVSGRAVKELGRNLQREKLEFWKRTKLALICPGGMTNFRQKLQGSRFGVKIGRISQQIELLKNRMDLFCY